MARLPDQWQATANDSDKLNLMMICLFQKAKINITGLEVSLLAGYIAQNTYIVIPWPKTPEDRLIWHKKQRGWEKELWSLCCFQGSQFHLACDGFRSSHNIWGIEWVSTIRLWNQQWTQLMSECKFVWNSYCTANQKDILKTMYCKYNFEQNALMHSVCMQFNGTNRFHCWSF